MAFPTDWGRRCPLVIQANKVDSNQSDFPVLLTKDTLPSEMFDADGSYPALNGGGDIRFSSDSDGSTQLACEVVTFTTDNDPTNGVAEIWVKVPSVSSSTNTIIYIWYNKAGESQPASSDTYGSENVWDSNFEMVQHMNEDPSGSAPQMIDSISNGNGGTSYGSMTGGDLVDGKIGKALDFDGSDDYVGVGYTTDLTRWTIRSWVKSPASPANSTANSPIYRGNNYQICWDDTSADFRGVGAAKIGSTWYFSSFGTLNADTWYFLVVTYDGETLKAYKDNNLITSNTDPSGNPDSETASLELGRHYTDAYFKGIIDEVCISSIARSADWIKAEYNNQNDPSTFVIEGTPEYTWVMYCFSGYTFEQNNPVSRKLYLHNRSTGELVTTTTSSGNGYYYMETSFSGSHYIVCLDDVAGVEYNDLIIGPAFPATVSG